MEVKGDKPEIQMTVPKNPEMLQFSLTQTSKGFWYVDKLSVYSGSMEELLKRHDKLMEEVIVRLNKLNGSGDMFE